MSITMQEVSGFVHYSNVFSYFATDSPQERF